MDNNKYKNLRKPILTTIIVFGHLAYLMIVASVAMVAYEAKGIPGALLGAGFLLGVYCVLAYLILSEIDVI